LRKRAVAYAVTGRRGHAIADVNVLLRMDSRDAEAHYAMGLANFTSPRVAIPAFSKVISFQPDWIEGYRGRAWLTWSTGTTMTQSETSTRCCDGSLTTPKPIAAARGPGCTTASTIAPRRLHRGPPAFATPR
jgi:hypothetical protein